jgi:hypothetical protein
MLLAAAGTQKDEQCRGAGSSDPAGHGREKRAQRSPEACPTITILIFDAGAVAR